MKQIKLFFLINALVFGTPKSTFSQVAKQSIIEHFTNSNCSVCANLNPGFYKTLSSYPNVLHISFYPSSPYSSCFFSMQNPIDNDARTSYYNLFGSTPKFTVNGKVVASNMINAELSNIVSNTSNFYITSEQTEISSDSIQVKVIIKKVSTDTTKMASLFVGVKEDTVFKTTNNGEALHLDVFRKKLTGITGDIIVLPNSIGDSISMTFAYKSIPGWNINRLQTFAILQNNSNREVLNVGVSKRSKKSSAIAKLEEHKLNISLNSTQDIIQVDESIAIGKCELYSLNGNKIKIELNDHSHTIKIGDLPNGIYVLAFDLNYTQYFHKLSIIK